MITRRDFVAAASALAMAPNVKAFAASGAEVSQGPLLISVFLRGGMDALSFIAPVDDPDYIAARTAELRLLGDGARPRAPLGRWAEGE